MVECLPSSRISFTSKCRCEVHVQDDNGINMTLSRINNNQEYDSDYNIELIDLSSCSSSDLEDHHIFSFTNKIDKSQSRDTDEICTKLQEREAYLQKWSSDQILDVLVQHGAAFVCKCGMIFRDKFLYNCHKQCHSVIDEKQCCLCGYVSTDWMDFHKHFTTRCHTQHRTRSRTRQIPQ